MSTDPRPGDIEMAAAIRRELAFARTLSRPVLVTWWLLVSNIVLFVVAYFYGLRFTDGFGFSAEYLRPVQMVFASGMKLNEHIEGGQWWRIVSAMWVHLDMIHIGFNGYGLYAIGMLLEKFYGGRRLLLLYMLSGLVAGWASFYFSDTPSGGASGAVYGLVGALLVFGVKYRQSLPPQVARALTVGMAPWVVIGIGIGFLDAIPFDNAAHVGGLLSGGAFALVFGSNLQQRTQRVGNVFLWIGATACAAVIVTTAWFWSAEAYSCLGNREDYLGCYPDLAQYVIPGQKPPGD